MKKCMALVCDSIEEDLSGVELKEIDLPELSSKDVLINVKAASVNFPDLLMTQGKYQHFWFGYQNRHQICLSLTSWS